MKSNMTNKGDELEELKTVSESLEILYEEAKSLVILHRKASSALIQRRLRVSYETSMQFIEKMELEGIVGPPNKEHFREVLVGHKGSNEVPDSIKHKKEVEELTNILIQDEKRKEEYLAEKLEKERKQKKWDKNKIWYFFVGGIIFAVIGLYFYNQRGGLYLVNACDFSDTNPDTFEVKEKCYKLEANLPASWRRSGDSKLKLFFSNGGNIDVYCEGQREDAPICESDDGRLWDITVISRLGNFR